MKLFLINCFFLTLFVLCNAVSANNFETKYSVSSSGIKIGELNWYLKIIENKYETKIVLMNSGIFSPLYKFDGNYTSNGIIEDNKFKTKNYEQHWKTKKKIKIVKMSFGDGVVTINQSPAEKEFPRVNLSNLPSHFDPITSFMNILNGQESAYTIDGRRVYTMKRDFIKSDVITLQINKYKNIWADHKRNDLKKIEFFISNEMFLPEKIKIYFKNRVFRLIKD